MAKKIGKHHYKVIKAQCDNYAELHSIQVKYFSYILNPHLCIDDGFLEEIVQKQIAQVWVLVKRLFDVAQENTKNKNIPF